MRGIACVVAVFVVCALLQGLRGQTIPLDPDPYWYRNFSTERSLCLADIDGDGFLDLGIVRESATNIILMNNAGVLDTVPTWYSGSPDTTIGIAFGDYDNDGDLDMATAGPYFLNGRLKLHRNDGGTITQNHVWMSGSQGGMCCVWGDVDNDGDLDLASCDMMAYPSVHYNNGGLLETNPSWQASDYNIDEFCTWADINRDGWLDLVVGNYTGSQPPLRIYFNDSTGTLENPASWVSRADAATFSTGGVSAGDIDKDGWIDVFTANGAGIALNDQNNSGYHNNLGTLDTLPSWVSGDVYNSIGCMLGDINGDGYLDWAVANHYDGRPAASVYANNNGILQTLPWNTNVDNATWNLDIGDIDRDGITVREDTVTADGHLKLFYLSVMPIHRILEITVDGNSVPLSGYACCLKSGWVTLANTPFSGSVIIFRYEYSIDMELVVSGTWVFENTSAAIHERQENIKPTIELSNFPNPFFEKTTIAFTLPRAGDVSLEIFDCTGRLVRRWNDHLDAGKHSYGLQGKNLKPGVYFCTIGALGKTYKTKIIKGG